MIRPVHHIDQMAAYAVADIQTPDGVAPISLSQNECLRPPSPLALEAARGALDDGMFYPDPDWTMLRRALAAQFSVAFEGIVCGNGSLDLIGCLARAYAGPERAVLAPVHAYPFFNTAAQMVAARFDTAAEADEAVSVDALLGAVQPDTGIVFVANPGNPTGTRIPKDELLRLRAGLRDDILLVIDEAYGEFTDHLKEPCFDMVASGNTAVLRTFSKAYAMAGFRVGWGSFPGDVAQALRKVTNPNNVSSPAQAAAVAALADQAYMRETCAQTIRLRDQITTDLREAGFDARASHTNFVLIDFGSADVARRVDQFIRTKGIILRQQGGAGLAHMLRITIGPLDALDKALAALIAWKEGEMT